MKKAKAILYVSIYVDCPECSESMDLMTDVDYANDEGQMWGVINDSSKPQGWECLNMEMRCPHCKKEFIFDSMEY